jgi:DNA-binding XRE family transcriptional regulator
MKQRLKKDFNPNERKLDAIRIKCESSNHLGTVLKELRNGRKLTQEAAAKIVGVSQTMWHAYETGKTTPSIDTVISIAKAMEISPFALISRVLDKSKYFNPAYHLSFDDFQDIEENEIKERRKLRLTQQLEALC